MDATTKLTPQRRRGKPSDGGEFVVFEAVPVFDEHVGDDGVHYDADLLGKIAVNCNRRIRDTGDWCPVVVAHTRDADDKRSVTDDPPVVGVCGPFWVGTIGNLRPRPCIMANFWIFPEHERTFLRNPRRSVEIWPEERPEDRYFDPICLLGAETPKRDLGMFYSRKRTGTAPVRYTVPGPLRYSKRRRGGPLRYEATCAGGGAGSNTFIAASTNLRKPQRNEKQGGESMSPDDLAQLADALKPLIQAMVEDAVVATQSSEPSELPPEEPLDGGGAAPDAGGAPLTPEGGGLDAGGVPAPVPAEPVVEGGEPAAEPEGNEFDALEDEDKSYAKGLGRKFLKYRRGGDDSPDWDDDGADKFVDSLDEEDSGMLDKFMKYACGCSKTRQRYAQRYGKDWEEEPAKKDGEPDKYAAGQPSDDVDPDKAKQILKDGEVRGEPLSDKQKGMFGAAAGKYAKGGDMVLRYRKLAAEHDDLKIRYSKVVVELDGANKELVQRRASERYAKRWSVLGDLEAQGYCFDREEEMELTEDMSEDQFSRHTTVVIPQRYNKISARPLPVEPAAKLKTDSDKPAQYIKPARELVERYRKQGRSIGFADVLKHLIEREGKVDEAVLLNVNGNGNGKR